MGGVFEGGELSDLPLVQVFIERDAKPRFVPQDDARFSRKLAYLREIVDAAGFATAYDADGEVIRPRPR